MIVYRNPEKVSYADKRTIYKHQFFKFIYASFFILERLQELHIYKSENASVVYSLSFSDRGEVLPLLPTGLTLRLPAYQDHPQRSPLLYNF